MSLWDRLFTIGRWGKDEGGTWGRKESRGVSLIFMTDISITACSFFHQRYPSFEDDHTGMPRTTLLST